MRKLHQSLKKWRKNLIRETLGSKSAVIEGIVEEANSQQKNGD